VNLIYGINGTGKSTLASLLRQAADDANWSTGLDIDVSNDDGTARRVSSAEDAIWDAVRVFNRDYVDANLKFDDAAGSTAAPLLVLGETRVDAEKQRTQLQARLDAISESIPQLKKNRDQAKSKRDALATARARVITDELGSLGKRYAPRSYMAPQVKTVIGQGLAAATTKDADVSADLSLVRSDAKAVLAVASDTELSLAEIAADVATVIGETAISKTLPELVGHPSRSQWVQDGISLHHDHKTCFFCGNNVDDERRQALSKHFDTSLLRIQEAIATLERQLDERQTACKTIIAELPRSNDLFPSCQTDYKTALSTITSQSRQFLESVTRLRDLLTTKHSSPFTPLAESVELNTTKLSLVAVNSVIETHNATAREFDKKRTQAAERVERVRIAEVAGEYRALDIDFHQYSTQHETLTQEEIDVKAQLSALNHQHLDAEPIASQLNTDLAYLLGRSDLGFSLAGQGYRITRNGTPAQHLSEGERNAISLLYFLCSLGTHETQSDNCVIVIDDPVSSLDGNALVGASTHLWTRLVGASKFRRLFLLTHNFELFRMWSLQLGHYNRNRSKGAPKLTHQIYEMRCAITKDVHGEFVRVPILMPWPSEQSVQNRLRSEYHYLFWRVSTGLEECGTSPSPEKDIEAATVLPNVCRRLLEGFLGFKYPADLGNLHSQVMKASDGVLPEATRARVLRFVHAYSHNPEADITVSIARPESVAMLTIVLQFMRSVDPEHFAAMCEAVHVDASFLDALPT